MSTEATPRTEPRTEVSWFAHHMEERLAANDHKGHWDDCESEWLLMRLREEADELEAELRKSPLDRHSTVREAADVANFALMLATNAFSRSVDAEITGEREAAAPDTPLNVLDRIKERLAMREVSVGALDAYNKLSVTMVLDSEIARLRGEQP